MAEEKSFILCNLDALSEIMAGNINDAITFFFAPYFVCSLLILPCSCWNYVGS